MRVLVTGCGGHVGSAVSRRLAEAGHVVTGLDVREGPGVTVVGSVDDPAAVDRAMRGVEAVIHVAALHVPDVGRRPPEDFWRVNVEGTRLLLEAAAANRVGRWISGHYGSDGVCAERDASGWSRDHGSNVVRAATHRARVCI